MVLASCLRATEFLQIGEVRYVGPTELLLVRRDARRKNDGRFEHGPTQGAGGVETSAKGA